MLPKKYRLKKPTDFHRVHEEGRCWSDHRVVLCKCPNDLLYSRFGFSVSKRIGKAVVRNRVKRLLRHAVRIHIEGIQPGWDVVVIARKGIVGADYWDVVNSVTLLLDQAHLHEAKGEMEMGPGRFGTATGTDGSPQT